MAPREGTTLPCATPPWPTRRGGEHNYAYERDGRRARPPAHSRDGAQNESESDRCLAVAFHSPGGR
jgi:hypothetical protein